MVFVFLCICLFFVFLTAQMTFWLNHSGILTTLTWTHLCTIHKDIIINSLFGCIVAILQGVNILFDGKSFSHFLNANVLNYKNNKNRTYLKPNQKVFMLNIGQTGNLITNNSHYYLSRVWPSRKTQQSVGHWWIIRTEVSRWRKLRSSSVCF